MSSPVWLVFGEYFIFLGGGQIYGYMIQSFRDSEPTEIWADIEAWNFRCYEIAISLRL